jgi:ABC-2 type transport system ATP-binding protein
MIQIKDLNFGYTRKHLLFKDLNLDLSNGHIYGLLGKNGAGKSTLLHNLTGLAYPKSGACYINGINSADRSVAVLEDLYFIPEEIYVPSVTADRFVKDTAHFYPKFNEEQYYNYLGEFDIPAGAILDKMSFGQQKKAMIAFGLATNTSLLVMDEPTNGLDIPSKVQFRKIIASVLTEERCIIISTHQVRDLDSLIDTLLVLHEKEIVVNRPMDEVVEKLTFGFYADTEGLKPVYEEKDMRGTNAILQNTTGRFSKVDLELLFNAIISGNKKIVELLKAS